MKWAVNMRTKTLTICLDPNEVMALYVARREVAQVVVEGQVSIWFEGLGKIIEDGAEAMFPLAFPVRRDNGGGPYPKVEKVAWNEICDES